MKKDPWVDPIKHGMIPASRPYEEEEEAKA